MSGRVVGWAFQRRDLSPSQKLVLVALADNASDDGICWPGQQALAQKTGLAERTIRDGLAALEERKLLSREQRMKVEGRGRLTDMYRLSVDQPAAAAARKDRGRPTGKSRTTNRQLTPDQPATDDIALHREPSRNRQENRQGSASTDADVERLCSLMAALSTERCDSRRFKVTATWRREMERLIRLDGRTPEQIEYVIRWVHGDTFWGPNVLAVPKLRERFDTLVAKIKAGSRNGHGSKADRVQSRVQTFRAMADQLESEGR